jgi:hypothetical protein
MFPCSSAGIGKVSCKVTNGSYSTPDGRTCLCDAPNSYYAGESLGCLGALPGPPVNSVMVMAHQSDGSPLLAYALAICLTCYPAVFLRVVDSCVGL